MTPWDDLLTSTSDMAIPYLSKLPNGLFADLLDTIGDYFDEEDSSYPELNWVAQEAARRLRG